jgi:radical SAM protein with 4Fe4S-binding SPASM domain
VRCNAPEFSAVIESDGTIRPCFFVAGADRLDGQGLVNALNSPAQRRLRADIRAGRRPECRHCVCSKWFSP